MRWPAAVGYGTVSGMKIIPRMSRGKPSRPVHTIVGMPAWEGCTDADISVILQAHGLSHMPHVYEDWLRQYGRGPGRDPIFHKQGGIAYMPEVFENSAEARAIVAGMPTSYELPPGALVVSTWQGYMFEFVMTDDGDDPPLLVYIEGEDVAQRQESRPLSNWLADLLRTENGQGCS